MIWHGDKVSFVVKFHIFSESSKNGDTHSSEDEAEETEDVEVEEDAPTLSEDA